MSKDLKKEYTEMIQADLPDLWDRISSVLPEKEAEKPRKQKTKIYRFAALAAACVCVAVIVPVVILSSNRVNQRTAAQTEYSTADAGAERASASAETQELEFAVSGAAAEEIVPSSGSAYEAAEASAEDTAKSLSASSMQIANTAPMMEKSAPAEDAAAEAEEAVPYYYGIELSVTKQIPGPDGLLCYEALVLSDTDGFAEGDMITIAADEYTPDEYKEELAEGKYTFDLEEGRDDEGKQIYLIR